MAVIRTPGASGGRRVGLIRRGEALSLANIIRAANAKSGEDSVKAEKRMVVVRFKVQCQPDKTDAMVEAMKEIIGACRPLPGVIHFDIARDLMDPHSLIATEVFEDRAAMKNEESQPEIAKVIELMQAGALTRPPEWTIFDVASSESPTM